jgi:2-keto-4-pentenoate hydratase
MSTPTMIDEATARLVAARRSGTAAAAPGLADAEAAYAVQDGVARALGWWGEAAAPQHWKSGGASRSAAQTHARLPPAGVWASPADARAWPFALRGVEAEIALRLREPVDAARAAALDADGARALVDVMCVAIELVDSRWREALAAPALARLADLQSHAALVLGPWVAFDATRDWSAQRGELRLGARAPLAFTGTHSMADPAWVLPAWLRHATRAGAIVPAGSVVTTGTWCGCPMAEAGERVVASFDGVGQASVEL